MICILGAMDPEIRALIDSLSGCRAVEDGYFTWHLGLLENEQVVIGKTGVGKVLAAATTQRAIDRFSPAVVICTGVAGALAEDLEIGDLLISRDCMQHDMDATALGFARGEIPYASFRIFTADPRLVELACGHTPAAGRVRAGRVLSGDQFISCQDGSRHRLLRQELGGDAVEMEGAAVGLVARLHAVPFIVARTISDRADGDAAADFNAVLPRVVDNSCGLTRYLVSRF